MFTLTWSDTALDQLADVYVVLDSEQRAQLASAVESLNNRLQGDPLEVGESRIGGFRLAFVPQLAILFHVAETNRTVRVMRVRRSKH